jgi:hypothetical protein
MKIQFTAYVKHDLVTMMKIGLLSGLVGGFALFSSFFWIDVDLGVAPGTFYKMVGVVVGLHEMPAIIFGFFCTYDYRSSHRNGLLRCFFIPQISENRWNIKGYCCWNYNWN